MKYHFESYCEQFLRACLEFFIILFLMNQHPVFRQVKRALTQATHCF